MILPKYFGTTIVLITLSLAACLEHEAALEPKREAKYYPLRTFQKCSEDSECEVVPVGDASRCEEFDAVNREFLSVYRNQRQRTFGSLMRLCAEELTARESYCKQHYCEVRMQPDFSCGVLTIPSDTIHLSSFAVDSYAVLPGHALSDFCPVWPGAPETVHGDEATFTFKPQRAGFYRLTLHHDGSDARYIYVGSGIGDCSGMSSTSCQYCPPTAKSCSDTLTHLNVRDSAAVISIRNCNRSCRLSLEYLDPEHTRQAH